jgi:hypothetical protein
LVRFNADQSVFSSFNPRFAVTKRNRFLRAYMTLASLGSTLRDPARVTTISMTSWKSQMRAVAAFQRQAERAAIKQQRELERRAKESAKLNAIGQARLEVDEHENQIEILLSIHKDCADAIDWAASAATLSPPRPTKGSYHELRTKQELSIRLPHEQHGWEEKIEVARLQDERVFQAALAEYENRHNDWEKLVTLARNVRAGVPAAYSEAINELSALGEIRHFGSSTEFTVHNPRLLECALGLNSSSAIPSTVKSLTASNKVSEKPMPTARFHELYQDYVCSCMLRLARELFALLPIEMLLLTARAAITNTRTGQTGEHAVLSVVLPREALATLNFDQLDPSDAIESFHHRGDFKASRKAGAFAPVTPLTLKDIMPTSSETLGFADLLKEARRLRQELAAKLSSLPKPFVSITP